MLVTRDLIESLSAVKMPELFAKEMALVSARRGTPDVDRVGLFDAICENFFKREMPPDEYAEFKGMIEFISDRILIIDNVAKTAAVYKHKYLSQALKNDPQFKKLRKYCREKKQILVIARLDYAFMFDASLIGFALDPANYREKNETAGHNLPFESPSL